MKPNLFHQIKRYQIILLAVLWFLSGCRTLPAGNSTTSSPDDSPSNGNPGGESAWYSVHFTDPGSPEAASYEGGPGEALAQAISEARLTVDAAVYSFNLWGVRDALLDAKRSGVEVRVVTDSDNLDEPEIQELIEAGIVVVDDRSDSLMHNKFFVIDRIEVWSGSMNPTLGGAYYDNNNLIRVRSQLLAENYSTEFEEMYTDYSFSQGSIPNTPHAVIEEHGTRIETYFSPDDGVSSRILEQISSAEDSIYFMAYSFTSDDIAAEMIERASAGVQVSGVMDETQYRSNTGTEYEQLISGGVDVRLDGSPDHMHHKVIIIDESIVITGSYNFSASAENRNDENILILHNAEIAQLYLNEFMRVYNEAEEDSSLRSE